MKPYSVEIFDKNLNFQFNALIEDFSYKTDAVTQVKNTFQITKDFNPVSDVRGWYIRISRYNDWEYNEIYDGVITAFEKGEEFNAVTFTDLITLFDLDVPLENSSLQGRTIESFIEKVILDNFKNSTDTAQNLSVMISTNITTSTYGSLECLNANEEIVSVNILHDILNPAYSLYSVYTRVTFNLQYKDIELWIGIPNYTQKTIESDLPNVVDSQFTIKKEQSTQINKVIIYDSYTKQQFNYYLYTDGTISTSSSISGKTRETPVHTKILTADRYALAKQVVDGKYNNEIDVINEYSTLQRNLTNSEYSKFRPAAEDLGVKYLHLVSSIIMPNVSFNQYPVYYEEPDETRFYSFTLREPIGSNYKDTYFTGGQSKYPDRDYWGVGKYVSYGANNKNTVHGYVYDDEYNFLGHAAFETTFDINGYYVIPDDENQYDVEEYDYYCVPFTADMARQAVSAYKNTADYVSEIDSKVNDESIYDQLEEWALAEFSKNSYSNYIEITTLQTDSMLKPQNMKIGQVVNIIHDGISYNSILTGKEISGGLIKLIFGTIRLDLTKILNMRGGH